MSLTYVHIAVAADENYVPHAAVTMLSACMHSGVGQGLWFHFLSNGVSQRSLRELQRMVEDQGHVLSSYEIGNMEELAGTKLHGSIAVSAYSRLFLASMLPQNVKRLIYFDADSVVADDLVDLWNADLDDCLLGAVWDASQPEWSSKIGIPPDSGYINSGMLLIPLARWREEGIEQQFVSFLQQRGGRVFHHDQGVINAVLAGRIRILHPRYNLMTFMYELSAKEVRKLYGTVQFYNEEEHKEAKDFPCFIHFTPSLSNRPWVEGCMHPEAWRYREARARTPWRDWSPAPDRRRLHVKLLAGSYHLCGFWGLFLVSKLMFLISVITRRHP